MSILALLIFFGCKSLDSTKVQPTAKVDYANKIAIDVSKITHQVSKNPGGVVSCWLMDSDKEMPRKTSFKNAMKDMGVKYIRYPYGHLADNYLWDADGDWGNTLTPKIATIAQTPGKWKWAYDEKTLEFKNDMDFDEYIAICKEIGAEPMVVVNVLSYKYKNGPSYEELKKTATEWVKYANITKKYGVKYWALGNEVDHHPEFISKEEYINLYSDFAKAMRAVDPTIKVGPGLLGKWHAEILAHDPDNIGFICVHNYLFKYDWRNQDYEGWKHTESIMISNVEKVQRQVNNSPIPDTEIHVTEMNSRPWSNKSDNDDLFRALAYAEMQMNAISFEDVKATYAWNTHSPWGGLQKNATYNVLDLDNNREPRGDVIKLINENLLDNFIQVNRVHGFIRSYATVDNKNEKIIVILINKNDQVESTQLDISNFENFKSYTVQSYFGNNPLDESPELSEIEKFKSKNSKKLNINLKPLSLTIININ